MRQIEIKQSGVLFMRYFSDLHTHSTASDGQYSPSELVRRAKECGIEVLALTDHDTVGGLREAVQAGEEFGLRVIRGIELSAKEYPTFHILGYNFDVQSPELSALCQDMKEGRDARSMRIISFLREKGVEIPLSEVEELAGGNIVGRPHFAQVLTRRGYVSNNREAFDCYLDTDEFHQRVERSKPSAKRCVETIKAAGGKVSLAHPYQIGVSDGELEGIVKELASWGLDAIECWYPKHTPEQQRFYLELAKKHRLNVTGGSDFHGERVKPEICLAALELEVDWLFE